MNSILQDMREIVCAAAPELRAYSENGPDRLNALARLLNLRGARDYDLWHELWASIKPIKFGNSITWADATSGTLARYLVPRNTHCLVTRVHTYSVNYTAAAADVCAVAPPPPGTAWWQYENLGSTQIQVLTDISMPAQVMADAEEFLIFKGGYYVTLNIDFSSAPPSAQAREVRTTVYGYNCDAAIIDRIAGNQAIAEIT